MQCDVEELIRDARIAIDENKVSGQLAVLGDIDTLSLDDIIESKVCDAVRAVEQAAPSHLLNGGDSLDCSKLQWDKEAGKGMGSIPLPGTFMRLLSFKMSDWSHGVTAAIGEDDARYALQHSRYGGLAGNPQRPVVAIVSRTSGLVLEFYSCTGGDGVTVDYARYLPLPSISNGKIEICQGLRTAVVYYIAYLTALSIKDGDLAKAMLEIGNSYMA